MTHRANFAVSSLFVLLSACSTSGGDGDGEGDASGPGPGSFGSESGAPTSSGSGLTEVATATGEVSGGTSTSGSSSEGGTTRTDTDDATTGPTLSDDEVLMRAAIAGEEEPGAALRTIADRGGLPVVTSTGSFLFGCLCGPGTWNLSGAHNGWADSPMGVTGPMVWSEADIGEPVGSMYKFHDTDQDQWIADPLGRRYGFDEFGRFSLVRAEAAHLERWFAVAGEGLGPRDLQVWVPNGGEFTHALYVHDGQNLFDPDTSYGGWRLQDSVPPGVLLVGIDNTGLGRMEEYTHVEDVINQDPIGGQGEAYADLVEHTIRPRMEAAYGPAEVVGTMGSSLGGLIAFVIADRFPDTYAMAISLSGTMGWGSIGLHNETMIERYAGAGRRFALYVDSGGEGSCLDADDDGIDDDGDANDNYCENLQLRDVLEDVGYAVGEDLFYVYEPGGLHNELHWAARVGVPMATFAGL